MNKYISFRGGFTLIELLLVVTMIALLTGILVSIIQPGEIEDKAADGVRRSNLQKIVTGVEAYNAAEGAYPVENAASVDYSYEDELTSHPLSTYLDIWPDGEPVSTDLYQIWTTTSGTIYAVVIIDNSLGGCYKYHSIWGEIRECTASAACNISLVGNNTGCT